MPEKKKIQGLRFSCGCVVWLKDRLENIKVPFCCPEHGSPVAKTFEGHFDKEKEAADE